jgi:ribosomal-protein-alanine N-acetyltransferase
MTEPAPPVPDFATARLRLRRLAVGDAPGLHEAYGDAGAMRFWENPPSRSLAGTERRILSAQSADPARQAAWAVLTPADGRCVGMVNYHSRQPSARKLSVGWILVPRCWGHGYMTEAMHALLRHCFETLDTHRIEVEIAAENVRSLRLADRLGFRREALLADSLFPPGPHRPVWLYAAVRPV